MGIFINMVFLLEEIKDVDYKVWILLVVINLIAIVVLSKRAQAGKMRTIDELQTRNSRLEEENTRLKISEDNLQCLLKNKELELLKGSISPHFFKNTMSIMNSFAQKTLFSIQHLVPVLNHIVYESSSESIRLEDEIHFVNKFLALQELQLPPTFNLYKSIEIDSIMVENFRIIPMLLIDFIENAFKYTDLNNSKSYIKIKLRINDDSNLIYEVSNTPCKSESECKGGFGVDNLRKRLALAYQNEAVLDYEIAKNEYLARMIIPSYKNN